MTRLKPKEYIGGDCYVQEDIDQEVQLTVEIDDEAPLHTIYLNAKAAEALHNWLSEWLAWKELNRA